MTNPAEQKSFSQGLSLFKSGKYQEASEKFLQIINQNEGNHKAWNALGVSLSKIGDRENAKLCFENAVALDPNNITYNKNLLTFEPKKKPIKKVVLKPKGKPIPKKNKKRPITDYILAAGGMLFFIFFFFSIMGFMVGPHTPSQPAILPATTIPTAIITPSETHITPGPTTVISPSQTYLTPAPIAVPITQATPAGAVPMTVRFLEVGQGDSILLQAGGKNMLIDAGPATAGSSIVSYLKSAGVSSLDVIVATHPHEDHIGGMIGVLNSFPVGLYVDSGAVHTTSAYVNVMNKLRADQTPYAEVRAGKSIPFASGVNVQVLAPTTLTGDLNNDAIVLKITDGSESFLFMGDSADAPGDIKAQILKVAHHGSTSGTTAGFLSRVKPEVAVIEVGAGNDYGHPKPDTLANLQQAGVKVYRTDIDGTVTITTDGTIYKVETSKVVTPAPITSASTPIPVQTVIALSAPVSQPQPVKTQSSTVVCDCSGDRYSCNKKGADLPPGVSYQQCYDYCNSQGKGDIHGLDRDKDGGACEG